MTKNTDATDSKTREQTGHTPEPWLFDGQSLVAGETRHMLRADGVGWSQADAERIVACVNALAGIANPSAVAGLVEKVRALILTWEHEDDPVPSVMQNAYLREIRYLLVAPDSTVPKKE